MTFADLIDDPAFPETAIARANDPELPARLALASERAVRWLWTRGVPVTSRAPFEHLYRPSPKLSETPPTRVAGWSEYGLDVSDAFVFWRSRLPGSEEVTSIGARIPWEEIVVEIEQYLDGTSRVITEHLRDGLVIGTTEVDPERSEVLAELYEYEGRRPVGSRSFMWSSNPRAGLVAPREALGRPLATALEGLPAWIRQDGSPLQAEYEGDELRLIARPTDGRVIWKR